MIGLYGLIETELEKQGKLPPKYNRKIELNTLWDFSAQSLFASSEITYKGGVKDYRVLSKKAPCPLDLQSKSWSATIGVNVLSVSNTHTNYQVLMHVESEPVIQTLVSGPQLQVHHNYGQSAVYVNCKSGMNYLKLDWDANTQTLHSYYSYDGVQFTKFKQYTLTKVIDFVIVAHNHKTATVPVSTVKFVYDGEVLFGS